MCRLLQKSLRAGAFGILTGLYYAPGSHVDQEEICSLRSGARIREFPRQPHHRRRYLIRWAWLLRGEEGLDILDGTGVRTQISHLKALGPQVWGRPPELLARVRETRAQGTSVLCDQYPYQATGSSITGVLIPRWAQEEGRSALLAQLRNADLRPRPTEHVRQDLQRRDGAERLLIASYSPCPDPQLGSKERG